ncbi:MAG TPA: prephenate dehydrogenase/arogenate dehydrogenase family protein [Acidimicrobiales bacterium]|nr:prephenate dehydrogenase/arogenate dehydrogenase family protein [Acidimicrobiales bacterium]
MTFLLSRHAHVIGLGLIGSSVALALTDAGWLVTGTDVDRAVVDAALNAGVIVATDRHHDTTLVVIATPASVVAETANALLRDTSTASLIVTDVAGVKGAIVASVADPRFLAGHPMAGSELRGLAGARADLFQGCTWVLTPTSVTRPETYGTLHGVLRELGANVVAVDADDHDRLVAVASHVPHLLAGALMNEASRVAEEDTVLLQLAAGGFRDMTRVAAGDPGIWPDVLFENRVAISQSLQSLEARLAALRTALNDEDHDTVADDLLRAASARRQLPGRALNSENLAYLRVAVSDQPGVLAAVTMAASEMLVNIYDIEIAHGIEGSSGTLLLAIDARQAEPFSATLAAMGFLVGHE